MPAVWFTLNARDSQSSPVGKRVTGLKPKWVFWQRLADAAPITTQPAIVEVGYGVYKFSHDPYALGEAVGQIDLGDTFVAETDRYIDVAVTNDTSGNMRAITGVPPAPKYTLTTTMTPGGS